MHLKRILSALVAVPCLYLLISRGGTFGFAILVSVAALIALSEYYYIVLNKLNASVFGPVPLVGYFFSQAIVFTAFKYPGRFEMITGLIVLNFILAGFVSLFQYKSESRILEVLSKQVQGVIYIPVLISSLILIRNDPQNGVAWIFYILLLVGACDTGAYYAGTYLGKHKLCPSVSPGKTIEGFIGGLALTLVFGLLVKLYFFQSFSWEMTTIFLVSVSVAGPVGDLFESVLKRTGGIKDSGSIIPGHGGILDRIDALLFVAPVAYVFKFYLL